MATGTRNRTQTKSIQSKKSPPWEAVSATFVMRWARRMPADDVLAEWWEAAIAGLTGVDIHCYQIDDIHRKDAVTELRCSLLFLAPIPKALPDLARYLERHASDLCAWLGATEFAIFGAAAKDEDDFTFIPPIISPGNRDDAIENIEDQLDDIDVPLHVRKVLDSVHTELKWGNTVGRITGRALSVGRSEVA
jgi:hypothetical protein